MFLSTSDGQNWCQDFMFKDVRIIQNIYQNICVAGICLESVQIPLGITPAPKHGMLQTKGGNVAFPQT